MHKTIYIPFDTPLEPSIRLHAGELICVLEKGKIRYIRSGKEELIRMIYGAVRDENWNTADYAIMDKRVNQYSSSFDITFIAVFSFGKPVYKMNCRIHGSRNNIPGTFWIDRLDVSGKMVNIEEENVGIAGVKARLSDEESGHISPQKPVKFKRVGYTLTYEIEGQALTDFKSNRTGICTLLPITSCRGQKTMVVTQDGNSYRNIFRQHICPHQPMKNIKQLEWVTAQNTKMTLAYEGDVFEMEDQRNWMDCSYKVYSRPLEWPYPYDVRKNEICYQKVTVHATPSPPYIPGTFKRVGYIAKHGVSSKKLRLSSDTPTVGYQMPENHELNTKVKLSRESFHGHHLRLELDMSGKWKTPLERTLCMARTLRSEIELIVLFTSEYATESMELFDALKDGSSKVKSLLPLHKDHDVTPHFLSEHLFERYKELLHHLQIGYGTDKYFAELNRNRPTTEQPHDFVSFSLNPQVHARDTRTLLENLHALPDIISTVRHFTDKPIHISPFTLQRRANHNQSGFLKEEFDERSEKNFALGWYLLALYFLQGLDQVTLFSLPFDADRNSISCKKNSNTPCQTLLHMHSDGPYSISLRKSENKIMIDVFTETGKSYRFLMDKAFLTADKFI